jgi:hypothetical protein
MPPTASVTSVSGTHVTVEVLGLALLGQDNATGSGVYQMWVEGDLERVGNNPGWVATWINYTTTTTVTVPTWTTGWKTIRVKYRDRAGWETGWVNADVYYSPWFKDYAGFFLSIAEGAAVGTTSVNLVFNPAGGMPQGTDMRIYGDVSAVGGSAAAVNSWISFASPQAITLTGGTGMKTVRAEVRNAAYTPIYSGEKIVEVLYGVLVPATATINQAPLYNSMWVDLTLNASGATQTYIAGDAAYVSTSSGWMAAGQWVTYQPAQPIKLSGADGPKTVSVKFKSGTFTTQPVYASIRIDTMPPDPIGIVVNGASSPGPAVTTDANVTLYLSAQDPSTPLKMWVEGDLASVGGSAANIGSWITYQSTIAAMLNTAGGIGLKTVKARFKDAAGNFGGWREDAIDYQSLTITGTVSIDQGGYTQNYLDGDGIPALPITLMLTSSDAANSQMYIVAPTTQAGPVAFNDGTLDLLLGFPTTRTGSWIPFASTATVFLVSGDGPKTVVVKFRRVGETSETTASDAITLDTAAPGQGTVSIDGGAVATGSPLVNLALNSTDATSGLGQMYVTGSVTGAGINSWVTYAASYSVSLTSGDGVKTVQVQYRDRAGNTSALPMAWDTIQLDTTGPNPGVVSITPNPTSSTSVTLTLNPTDPAGISMMRITGDITGGGSWVSYTGSSVNVTLSGTDGMRTVRVEYQDGLGNTSGPTPDAGVRLDTTPPSGTLSIVQSPRTSNPAINLTLTENGDLSVPIQMTFLGDVSDANGTDGVGEWIAYSNSHAITLNSASDGLKTVQVKYRDSLGNANATYAAQAGITLDRAGPTGTIAIDQSPRTANPAITLTLNAADGSLPMVMSFSGDVSDGGPSDGIGEWIAYNGTHALNLTNASDGLKTVSVQYKDSLGNTSILYDASITLDRAGPTPPTVIILGSDPTASISIDLSLTASDSATPLRMYIQGDVTGVGTYDWVTYVSNPMVSLAGADGLKTVTVIFRDSLGNTSSHYDTVSLSVGDGTIDINPNPTGSVLVNLALAAPATRNDQMYLSGDVTGLDTNTWITYASSYTVSLGGINGVKTVTVQYRELPNTTTNPISDTTRLDTTAPTGTLSINQAPRTSNPTVTLTLTENGDLSTPIQMTFLGDVADVNGSDGVGEWIAYSTSHSLTLNGASDGLKTVQVRYRDSVNNANATFAAQASITLDRQGPDPQSGVVLSPNPTASTAVTLNLDATDLYSTVEQMRLTGDVVGGGSWVTYQTSSSIVLSGGEGLNTVTVEYKDSLGNTSSAGGSTRLDTTAPTGTLSIAQAPRTNNPAINLNLTYSDLSTPIQMTFLGDVQDVNGTDGVGEWVLYFPGHVLTLNDVGDGLKTVQVRYRDSLGNANPTYAAQASITLDRQGPTGSILIDQAPRTANPAITLTLTAADGSLPMQMSFSGDVSDGGPADGVGEWIAYNGTHALNLTNASDGLKTVSVQYRDSLGNTSILYNASITLDRAGPTPPVVSIGGSDPTASTSVGLTLTAGDPAGMGLMYIQGDVTGLGTYDWVTYSASATVNLTSTDGLKTVTVIFRDALGNTSSANDVVTLDRTGPTGGSITIEGGAQYATSATVNLTLTASDVSGPLQMHIYGDVGATGWITYAGAYGVTLSGSDGQKTVKAEYRDALGNTSPEYNDSIFLDVNNPTGSVVISPAGTTTSANISLALTASDGVGSGISQMSIYGDITATNWITYQSSYNAMLTGIDGQKTVKVVYRDASGRTSPEYIDSVNLSTSNGSISIDQGTVTNNLSITLTLSAPAGNNSFMRITGNVTGANTGVWIVYGTTQSVSLTNSSGNKTVTVQYADGTITSTTTPISDGILLDVDLPTGSVSINEGTSTNQSTVNLTLNANDLTTPVTLMRIDGDVVGANTGIWIAYGTTQAVGLNTAGPDGTRMVTVKYRDQAGNESLTASDSIILDRAGPVSPTVNINAGAIYTTSANVTLALSATDASTSVSQMRISGDVTGTNWISYQTTYSITLNGGEGVKTVSVEYGDQVGNTSAAADDTITLDSQGPTGSVDINSGATATNNAAITLTLNASDTGSGISMMSIYGDTPATNWITYQSSYSVTLSGLDGQKTVKVQYRDNAGNTSPEYADGIFLDRAGPGTPSIVIQGNDPTNQTGVALTLSAIDPSGIGWMYLSGDVTGLDTNTWITYQSSYTVGLDTGSQGLKTVTVQFRDSLQNTGSTASDSVTLDTQGPTSPSILVNGGAATTSVVGVTLTLSAVGADVMRISGTGVSLSDPSYGVWISYQTVLSINLTLGDGLKTVQVIFADLAQNPHTGAPVPVTDTITLQQVTPTTATTGGPARGVLQDYAPGQKQGGNNGGGGGCFVQATW